MPVGSSVSARLNGDGVGRARSRTVVETIVEADLCSGCGLCAGIMPPGKLRMEMSAQGYLRPHRVGVLSDADEDAIARVCPGDGIDFTRLPEAGETPRDVLWGPLRSVSTGHATDAELRRWGSSGGGISALLMHLLESGAVDGVIHVVGSRSQPLRNEVTVSRDRAGVLAGAGSRYAPSAPLATIGALLDGPGRFAFVGKPCDVAGLRALARIDPRVDQSIPVVLSFLCAGIPSEAGTRDVLRALDMAPEEVTALRYRGDGWPGFFRAVGADGTPREMDYATSWGSVLNRHIQWRCKVCPDGIGEFADVVCADAWYEDKTGMPTFNERDGRSLILARTARGEALVAEAEAAGRLATAPLPVGEIEKMQPFQKKRRQLVLSRLAAMGLMLRRRPRFPGAGLIAAARTAPLRAHLRSLAGTALRLARKRAR